MVLMFVHQKVYTSYIFRWLKTNLIRRVLRAFSSFRSPSVRLKSASIKRKWTKNRFDKIYFWQNFMYTRHFYHWLLKLIQRKNLRKLFKIKLFFIIKRQSDKKLRSNKILYTTSKQSCLKLRQNRITKIVS